MVQNKRAATHAPCQGWQFTGMLTFLIQLSLCSALLLL